MQADLFLPQKPDFDRVARLGNLGNRLIALACVATGVCGIAAIAVPARSTGAVVVTVLLGLVTGLRIVLARRDRDVLDWTRSYPSRLFAGDGAEYNDFQDGVGPSDDEVDSVVDLDEATQDALAAGRRYDLGLSFALGPGILLLLFALVAYRPLHPGLQLVRAALLYLGVPVCVVAGLIEGSRRSAQGLAGRRLLRLFGHAWMLLAISALAWAFNGAADPGLGTVVHSRYVHGYRDVDSGGPAKATDPYRRFEVPFLGPLHLAWVAGLRGRLPIYDPKDAWVYGHSFGDPVRLTVGPGALGMRVIRRLVVGKRR